MMDVNEVSLLGDVSVAEQYRLLTQTGTIKGLIDAKENIDLAADYGIINRGGHLKARDVRIIGNYLGILSMIDAKRSYTRTGGLIADIDVVLANNVVTASLVSASLGLRLPNFSSTANDLLAMNNLIRASLT